MECICLYYCIIKRGDEMRSMISQVFYIIAVLMVASMILLTVSSDTGRAYIWSEVEPAFQRTWDRNTLSDGKLLDANLTGVFNDAEHLTR